MSVRPLGGRYERREVPHEMSGETILMSLHVFGEQRLQLVAESVEGAAERHMQYLSGVVVIEQVRQVSVGYGRWQRHSLEAGPDDVALPVDLEPLVADLERAAKQRRCDPRRDSQRFAV